MRLPATSPGSSARPATLARAVGRGRSALAGLAGLAALCRDRRAVTAVEYGIMAALIASALVVAIRPLRQGLVTEFGHIAVRMGGDPTMR